LERDRWAQEAQAVYDLLAAANARHLRLDLGRKTATWHEAAHFIAASARQIWLGTQPRQVRLGVSDRNSPLVKLTRKALVRIGDGLHELDAISRELRRETRERGASPGSEPDPSAEAAWHEWLRAHPRGVMPPARPGV
jgi:hypothetical protein